MKVVVILLLSQHLYYLSLALFAQGTKLFVIYDSFRRFLRIGPNVYQNDALKLQSTSVVSLVFEGTEFVFVSNSFSH